jgi:hypothetical protein
MKQVERPLEYWSASNLSDNLDSYTPIEHGEYKGRTGLSPPAAYPSFRRKGQYNHLFLHTQAPCLRMQQLPKSPVVPDPTDRQVKKMGTPCGTMNHHLNLALISITYVIWFIKHKVKHVITTTHKL